MPHFRSSDNPVMAPLGPFVTSSHKGPNSRLELCAWVPLKGLWQRQCQRAKSLLSERQASRQNFCNTLLRNDLYTLWRSSTLFPNFSWYLQLPAFTPRHPSPRPTCLKVPCAASRSIRKTMPGGCKCGAEWVLKSHSFGRGHCIGLACEGPEHLKVAPLYAKEWSQGQGLNDVCSKQIQLELATLGASNRPPRFRTSARSPPPAGNLLLCSTGVTNRARILPQQAMFSGTSCHERVLIKLRTSEKLSSAGGCPSEWQKIELWRDLDETRFRCTQGSDCPRIFSTAKHTPRARFLYPLSVLADVSAGGQDGFYPSQMTPAAF